METLIIIILFGLAWGSFLNVVIYRLPLGLNLSHPPSACSACKARIRPWDNIPVLSYLILRGKCRRCGHSISVRYFMVEILTPCLLVILHLRDGLSLDFFAGAALTSALIALAFIDFDHKILPDAITYPLAALGLAASFEVCRFLEAPEGGRGDLILALLRDRVSPGVDPAARVKVEWLTRIGRGETISPQVFRKDSVFLLGTMLGGYNIGPLVAFLEEPELAAAAAEALKRTILVYGAFDAVLGMSLKNPFARSVLKSWATGEWFLSKPAFPSSLTVKVFKVDGEINTDDFSPAKHASTRPDIPLHALAMGETRFPAGNGTIRSFREGGWGVAFAGDVVGTGSSRKSACNSVMWHICGG